MKSLSQIIAPVATVIACALAIYVFFTDDSEITQKRALDQLDRIAAAVTTGSIKLETAEEAAALTSAAELVARSSKVRVSQLLPNTAFMWKTGEGVFDLPPEETYLLTNTEGGEARLAVARLDENSVSTLLDGSVKYFKVGQSFEFKNTSKMHGCQLVLVKIILNAEAAFARFELGCDTQS